VLVDWDEEYYSGSSAVPELGQRVVAIGPTEKPFTFGMAKYQRAQVPLKPAFAVTHHVSQVSVMPGRGAAQTTTEDHSRSDRRALVSPSHFLCRGAPWTGLSAIHATSSCWGSCT
jgi:hypothetical protein